MMTLAKALELIQTHIPQARLVGDGSTRLDRVHTDTRTLQAGDLFVALKGERFDAHDFLPQAQAAGAAAAIASHGLAQAGISGIEVPDTLLALGALARAWRSEFELPLIAVTGSNGKTTVTQMIASILRTHVGGNGDAALATRGNFNNSIGMPLNLLRLSAAHRIAVLEMGMNHPGEIAELAAIGQPTVALVNNAQREHQEFMHTVEAVALENGAVLQALPPHGVAVFPGDDEYTPLWHTLAACPAMTFGLKPDECDVSCVYVSTGFGSDMQVDVAGLHGHHVTIKLAAAGEHNVRNALAAIACTLAAGIDIGTIVRGLEAFQPVGGRLQKKQAANGAVVIDDSYNANPDSVRAAIDVLASAPSPRILVLGDMGEVGTQGPEYHAEIGAYAQARGIDTVFVTGALTRHMGATAVHFDQFDELLAALDLKLGSKSDATVLVKGSRFMKMERVVQHLLGLHTTGKDAH